MKLRGHISIAHCISILVLSLIPIFDYIIMLAWNIKKKTDDDLNSIWLYDHLNIPGSLSRFLKLG